MLFPALQDFLSPAKAVPIKFNYYDDHTTLSITGEQRWRMLTSPHALTLMRAWAIQRQPANTSVEVDQENFIGPR